jgi:hypothetical protein
VTALKLVRGFGQCAGNYLSGLVQFAEFDEHLDQMQMDRRPMGRTHRLKLGRLTQVWQRASRLE